MNDREDIKERVKAAIDLVAYIGLEVELKKTGENEWKGLCPFHPDKTPSFSVFCKNGRWAYWCFGCDEGGDVFEWIMRRKNLAFPQALTIAANYAGVALDFPRERFYQPPEVRAASEPVRGPFNPDEFQALTVGGDAYRYLTERRKLPAALLTDYSVGETVDGLSYSFAYKWRPKDLPPGRPPRFEFCKVVKIARPDGKKEERRDPKGGRNILFGMCSPQVEASARDGKELVICEGEIDAISWAAYGYPAVSVPGGAKYTGWIDICWDWLRQFSKIHISFDEDAAGRMKVVEIVRRLGMAHTDIVRMPLKPV